MVAHRRRADRNGRLAGTPLESMYLVIFFDALRVKIREEAVVRNNAIYLALVRRP